MRRGDARARCPRTRSSATARAISRAGGTATGTMPPSPRSSPRPPARWAMASPPRSPPRCARPTGTVVALAGDGDFLMNGQELATAVQHGADILVLVIDNGAYGTIRMHQEREYPARLSRHDAAQPRFRRARPRLWLLGGDRRDDRGVRARARPRAGRDAACACCTSRPMSSSSRPARRSRRSGDSGLDDDQRRSRPSPR